MTEHLSILDELRETIDEEYGDEGSKELANPSYDDVKEEVKQVQEEPEEEEEPLLADEEEVEEEKPKKEKKPLPKSIPYERFQEVTQQRREFKENFERLERENAELRGQFMDFLKNKDAKPPPDPNEDPDGYIAHINAEYERLRGEHEKVVGQQKQSEEQSKEISAVNSYTQEKVDEFVSEHPDYFMAYSHLQGAIVQERLELGDSLQGAQDYFATVASNELQRLYKTKGDPAKYVYNMAKRYGYKAPNGETTMEEEEAPKKAKPTVSKEKAQKANRSVARAGRSAEVDLENVDIDNMTHSQFVKFVEEQKKSQGGQHRLID